MGLIIALVCLYAVSALLQWLLPGENVSLYGFALAGYGLFLLGPVAVIGIIVCLGIEVASHRER